MDALTATNPTTASRLSSQTSTASDRSVISSDFDTFLKMLTVQLENQDPLNPVDSADYAVQLATFSGVEQQAKTNDLLSQMLGQASASSMAQMADWIGKQVRAAAPAAFEGQPVEVVTTPLRGADRAEIVVLDVAGKERNRFAIPVSDSIVEWTGVDSSGTRVPWGTYSFHVESYDANGKMLASGRAEIYAEVTEARTDGSGVFLVLSGGAEVAADDVTAVRAGG